jgi:hypothetical protein
MKWKRKDMPGVGGTEEKGPGKRRAAEAALAGEAGGRRKHEAAATEGQAVWRGTNHHHCPVGLRRHRCLALRQRRVKRYGQGPGQGSLRGGLLLGAAAEDSENQAVRRASGGPGPGRGESREAREPAESRADRSSSTQAGGLEQSILDISDHIQICGSSVGIQARRRLRGARRPSARSVGPFGGLCVCQRHRATFNLAGNTALFLPGVEAGSERCTEPDD